MSWDAWLFVMDARHRLPAGFKHRAAAQAVLIEVANDLRQTKRNTSDLSQEQLSDLTGHDRKTIGLAQRALKDTDILKQVRPARARAKEAAVWELVPSALLIVSKSTHESIMSKFTHQSIMGKSTHESDSNVSKSTHDELPDTPVENPPHHGEIYSSSNRKSVSEQHIDGEIYSSNGAIMSKNGSLPQVPVKNKNKEQSVQPVENSQADPPQPPGQEHPAEDRRPSHEDAQKRTQTLARRRAAVAPSTKPGGNRAVITNLAFDVFGQRRPLGASPDDDQAVYEETARMENALKDACDAKGIGYDTTLIAYAVAKVRFIWDQDDGAWLGKPPRRRW